MLTDRGIPAPSRAGLQAGCLVLIGDDGQAVTAGLVLAAAVPLRPNR